MADLNNEADITRALWFLGLIIHRSTSRAMGTLQKIPTVIYEIR